MAYTTNGIAEPGQWTTVNVGAGSATAIVQCQSSTPLRVVVSTTTPGAQEPGLVVTRTGGAVPFAALGPSDLVFVTSADPDDAASWGAYVAAAS